MLINLFLLSINKSIFIAGMPISLPLYLFIFSLKRNLKREFLVNYLKIGGLGVQSFFNKNVIEPEDDKEYIKEAVNIVAILYIK